MYTIKKVEAGDVLITEGTIQPYIFILKSGKMSVIKSSGREIKILGEISPGEFIGEMAHLGSVKEHMASVIAQVDCELIEIESQNFLQVLAANPIWLKALLRSFVIRLEDLNNKK